MLFPIIFVSQVVRSSASPLCGKLQASHYSEKLTKKIKNVMNGAFSEIIFFIS